MGRQLSSPQAPHQVPAVRAILRVVVTVVLSVLALYLVYLLREPLSWMVIATFVAVAGLCSSLSGSSQHVRIVRVGIGV